MMTSEMQCQKNRMYYRAVEYVRQLYEKGLISRTEMRKANRYYAKYFQASILIFV